MAVGLIEKYEFLQAITTFFHTLSINNIKIRKIVKVGIFYDRRSSITHFVTIYVRTFNSFITSE